MSRGSVVCSRIPSATLPPAARCSRAALPCVASERNSVWATLYGLGGYLLGDNIHRLVGPVGIVFLVLAVLLILAGIVLVRRIEQRLEDEAERALPGPLDVSFSGRNIQGNPAASNQQCEAQGRKMPPHGG